MGACVLGMEGIDLERRRRGDDAPQSFRLVDRSGVASASRPEHKGLDRLAGDSAFLGARVAADD